MNNKATPKDFFLHLGATVALYAAAVALINLSFSVINYFNPDALAGYYYTNSIAWPISMLVILVPVLYLLEWLINRDIVKMSEKKDIWIRRWRIYLTLFLAAVLIIGDLIALINVYLNGEITARFIYKIIVILLVGGAVGKYYFFNIADTHKWAKMARRTITWFGLIMVLAAIVMGFVAVGSPQKQRDLRFDNQRVNDLTNIQWQVISRWQQTGKLPNNLTELSDAISGFYPPQDPETEAVYEYSSKWTPVMSSYPSFELCATFSRESQDVKGRGASYTSGMGGDAYYGKDISYPYPGGMNDSWAHKEGRTCFERTIDPTRYPVNQKPQAI